MIDRQKYVKKREFLRIGKASKAIQLVKEIEKVFF